MPRRLVEFISVGVINTIYIYHTANGSTVIPMFIQTKLTSRPVRWVTLLVTRVQTVIHHSVQWICSDLI